ncbi:SHOCT domain-containing protein [bacterium]|nr:SHOCT domain-containing protein [bacterium]
MNMFRLSVLVVALSVVGLSGCCGGGTHETKNITTTKTLGDQLVDLQKAKDSGAITEDQYNELKKKLIEQQTGN